MGLPNRERSKNMRHMRHPTPTRWLITPHPADLSRVMHRPLVREYVPFAAACLNSHSAGLATVETITFNVRFPFFLVLN